MGAKRKPRVAFSTQHLPPPTSWVRIKLRPPRGRKLRVLIYARYSTDEQNPLSIEAQSEFCQQFLRGLGLTECEFTFLSDRGISGERLFRPGINRVRAGIDAHEWDLIIVEDSSRLFRNVGGVMELAYAAIDNGIRLIAINDEVDSADAEIWEDRLYEAARHHAGANKYTRRRISRAHESLWRQGAAIGRLKPGYRREPSHPAENGEPATGPFFDAIDPDQAPVIHEAFTRVAAKEAPRSVAGWLTSIRFPKCNGSTNWTAANVIALIRRKVYRGIEEFRVRIAAKKHRTGERKLERNDPSQILIRDMPHLRIVSDFLHFEANSAIDEMCSRPTRARGADHRLSGIPRDSRGPLSGILVCGCCQSKMHVAGRLDGGYRCASASCRVCWNRASASRIETHNRLAASIVARLTSLDSELERLLAGVVALFDDQGRREARRTGLLAKQQSLAAALARLTAAIEAAEEAPTVLIKQVERREAELAAVNAELDGLASDDERQSPPTRRELDQQIRKHVELLPKMDRTVRDELERLVGRIEVVPFQQLGSAKVVLRARFELKLAALLPFRTRAALAKLGDGPIDEYFESIPMLVDLFEPSTGPKFGLKALALSESMGLTAIGKQLRITKRAANIAVQYGRSMRAAGVVDPYRELEEPPIHASRWRIAGRSDSSPRRKSS